MRPQLLRPEAPELGRVHLAAGVRRGELGDEDTEELVRANLGPRLRNQLPDGEHLPQHPEGTVRVGGHDGQPRNQRRLQAELPLLGRVGAPSAPGPVPGIPLCSERDGRGDERQAADLHGRPLGFSEAGRHFHRSILVPFVHGLGFEVLDPWALTDPARIDAVQRRPYGPEKRDAWRRLNREMGARNRAAIDEAEGVVAVLDGVDVDSGTAAEIGYAFARHRDGERGRHAGEGRPPGHRAGAAAQPGHAPDIPAEPLLRVRLQRAGAAAAGVLYPAFGLLLSPMVASAAMTVCSVSVIANALRLRRAPL